LPEWLQKDFRKKKFQVWENRLPSYAALITDETFSLSIGLVDITGDRHFSG
jgi:hypothetical protein